MQKGSKENLIVICTVVLCFAVTLGLCVALSGKGILGVFGSSAVESESVYAVAVGGYSDITLARTTSELIKSRGGAGYVLKEDEYEIVYAVYPKRDVADRVLAALGDSTAYVKEIAFGSSKLGWADGDMKEAAHKALSYYDTAFETLYKSANQLNASEASVEDVKTNIKVLYDTISDLKAQFYEHAGDSDAEQVTEIKLALITTLALIDNVELSADRSSSASSLRYQLVQLVLCHRTLMQRI